MADKIERLFGVIMEPNPVVTGPATWTYTVKVTYEDGFVQTVPGIVPANERPLASEIDARSVAPGFAIEGFDIPGRPQQWFIHEQPAYAPCLPGGGDTADPAAAPGGAEGSGTGLGGDTGTAGAE